MENLSVKYTAGDSLANYVFKKCSKTILGRLVADSVVPQLFCNDVLTQDEKDNIINLRNGDSRSKLLYTMMKKDEKGVELFIEVVISETPGQETMHEELKNAVREFRNEYAKASSVHGQIDASAEIWFEVESPVESSNGTRKAEVLELHELLTKHDGSPKVKNQIVTITGPSGVGKSELAKKYARDYCQYYDGNAIWLNALTRNTLRSSLVYLFEKHFNLSPEVSNRKTDEELLQMIYDCFSNKKCLIILDKVEDFDVVELLPKSLSPKVTPIPKILITQQKSVWVNGVADFKLEALSEAKAAVYVNKMITKNTIEHHVHILELQCRALPVFLQNGLPYINEGLLKIKAYLQLFEDQEGNAEAIRIMNIISVFASNPIPVGLFADLRPLNDESSLTQQEYLAAEAIAVLKECNVVSGELQTIKAHPLLQQVIRCNTKLNIEPILKECLELLEDYVEHVPTQDEFVISLLPHGEAVWRYSMKFKALLKEYVDKFPAWLCQNLRQQRRYYASLQLTRDSISIVSTYLEKDDMSIIRLQLEEAESLAYLDLKKAQEKLSEIYVTCKEKYGDSDPKTLLILKMQKSFLTFQKVPRNLPLGEVELKAELASIRQQLSSPNLDQDTITSALTRAGQLAAQNKLDYAIEILKEIIKKEVDLLGEDSAITTRELIGFFLFKQKKFSDAIIYYQQVYDARKLKLGPQDPLTKKTLKCLQDAQRKLKKQK